MDDYLKDLEREFADKSDQDLQQLRESAAQWRNWPWCDYIADEQKRRTAAVNALAEGDDHG